MAIVCCGSCGRLVTMGSDLGEGGWIFADGVSFRG
jgi:hypothetical protein